MPLLSFLGSHYRDDFHAAIAPQNLHLVRLKQTHRPVKARATSGLTEIGNRLCGTVADANNG
jgi:hypothetical protein